MAHAIAFSCRFEDSPPEVAVPAHASTHDLSAAALVTALSSIGSMTPYPFSVDLWLRRAAGS